MENGVAWHFHSNWKKKSGFLIFRFLWNVSLIRSWIVFYLEFLGFNRFNGDFQDLFNPIFGSDIEHALKEMGYKYRMGYVSDRLLFIFRFRLLHLFRTTRIEASWNFRTRRFRFLASSQFFMRSKLASPPKSVTFNGQSASQNCYTFLDLASQLNLRQIRAQFSIKPSRNPTQVCAKESSDNQRRYGYSRRKFRSTKIRF